MQNTMTTRTILTVFLALLAVYSQELEITEQVDIVPAWSGYRVFYDIATTDSLQYVAFYDSTQRMTIAKRALGSDQWQFKVLPSRVGWDSHNYVTLFMDDSGYIHISGNMHNDPLVYFRSAAPYAIDSFETPGMVGTLEKLVTYPKFFEDRDGNLIYQYRDGRAGRGNTIWNGYHLETKEWSRLTQDGLFNGEGGANAYHSTPLLGPDGYFHIVSMWREGDQNRNHTISHMKSLDLVNWETMSGQAITLPVTRSTPGVVVDPVEMYKGLINVGYVLGWDSQGRAVVSYHKYGEQGYSQLYNTRWETDQWKIYQASSWTSFRFDLSPNPLNFNLISSPVDIDNQGRLFQNWHHPEFGSGMWIFNEETMEVVEDLEDQSTPEVVKQLKQVESDFPGMEVRLIIKGEWYLRWESGPKARRAPPKPWPEPVMMRVYKLTAPPASTQKPIVSGKGMAVTKHKGKIVFRPEENESRITAFFVFTARGRQVYGSDDLAGPSVTWNTGDLEKGTYVFKVVLNGKVPLWHKLVVL